MGYDAEEKFIIGLNGLFLLVLVLVIFGPPIARLSGGVNYEFSSGERAGVVMKLSKKGIIYKTWEGQLQLGAITAGSGGTAIPETWEFSIPDDDLAHKILDAMTTGRRVKLAYKQVYLSGYRDGDSTYHITSFEYADGGAK